MDLQNMVGKQDKELTDHRKLCRLAYNFRTPSSSQYQALKLKIRDKSDNAIWDRIRHYIGRLGSWQRAASYVASQAPRFANELRDCQVYCIDNPRIYHQIEFSGELATVLSRVCPKLEQKVYIASRLKTAQPLLKNLTTKRHHPIVHAEAAMAHFFDSKSLAFVHNSRYIACSKPSCYCCKLYLEEHPGRFLKRKASGNAYVTWYPPLLKDDDTRVRRKSAQTLQAITERTKQDILLDTKEGNFGVRQQFDSTTGKTAMVPMIQM